jgi:hypothetical protein
MVTKWKADTRLQAEHFWPSSVEELSRSDLQGLDEYEFQRLAAHFVKREYKHTRSKKRARAIKRMLKNRRAPYLGDTVLKAESKRFYRQSALLESFVPDRAKRWQKKWQKRIDGRVLTIEDFSFLDNPLKTLDTLRELALRECTDKNLKVHFIDEDVVDIAPYVILGLMRRDMMSFLAGGKIHPTITQVLHAVELDKFIRMRVSDTADKSIIPFQLRHYRIPEVRSQSPATDPTRKELTIDDLLKTINSWLAQMKMPRKLNEDAQANIINMVGEILDNAERHSNIVHGLGSWSVAGFMMKKGDEGNDKLVCHLAFISEGCSIAESLMSGEDKTKAAAKNYYDGISRKTRLEKETCYTVYALQDGVTRLPTNRAIGGSGLMEIAEVAANLSEESKNAVSQVTIISGKSCINFKTPYIRGLRGQNIGAPRTQYFNNFNQPTEAPDSSHVMDLKFPLPGTLISIRFTLEETALDIITPASAQI